MYQHLLSCFILGFVFFLLAARGSKQWFWRSCTITWRSTFCVWLTGSRNVRMFLSIPVHVLLSVRVVVVLQRQREMQKQIEIPRGISETHTHTQMSYKTYRLLWAVYLWIRVIVETCKWVIIVARAFVIVVSGDIWHSCSMRHMVFASGSDFQYFFLNER